MTIQIKKPVLNKGSNYKVEVYPTGLVFDSTYLGYAESARRYIFTAKIKEEQTFLLLSDYWITENEKGIITYPRYSTSSIQRLTKDNLKLFSAEGKSRLLEILNEVGANL